MDEVWTTAIKAVDGGLFVVAFALLGEMALPRRFAGLFSAAPSVALANLLVIALAMVPAWRGSWRRSASVLLTPRRTDHGQHAFWRHSHGCGPSG